MEEEGKRQSSLIYRAGRFCVRCGRIALGGLLIVAATLVIEAIPDIRHVPFASLTLAMLAWNIAGALAVLVLIVWAFGTALGEGPRVPTPFDSARIIELAEMYLNF